MNSGINVLSLFNGMSFGMMAMDSLNIKVDKYYSSEIDKYANQATQAMFPDTIQLGDVTNWREWDIDWSSIDLVTGGFPCQAWSMAGKQLGDKDERGMLFWTMLDIMKHVRYHNPKANFLIENVKMKKEFEEYITTHTENALGKVYKVLINSALVSAQNRNRYYWTSFPVGQPKDKGILLKDIIENDVDESFYHTNKAIEYMEKGNDKWMQAGARRADRYTQSADKDKSFTVTANIHKGVPYNYFKCGQMIGRKINPANGKRDDYNPDLKTVQRIEIRSDEKTGTITTVQKDNLVIRDKSKCVRASGRGSYDRHEWDSISNCHYRKLTPRECFRLQTVPEHHIDTLLSAGISNTQLYKMCGNGWTMEVIKHILKGIK